MKMRKKNVKNSCSQCNRLSIIIGVNGTHKEMVTIVGAF